jgi:hypothetical protein
MKTVEGAVLGLVIAMGGWTCSAQEAAIAFEKLPEAPPAQLHQTLAAEVTPDLVASGMPSAFPSAAGFEPVHSAATPRVANARFFILNSLHLGMAIFDVEMTQRCIASHQCREGNPLMPSSQAGQLAVGFAFVAYGSGLSYWLKKHQSRMWWLPPAGGVVTHTVGVATGLMHQ